MRQRLFSRTLTTAAVCGVASFVAAAQLPLRREHFGTTVFSGFGYASAAIGDVDGDGLGDYAVGAPFPATASPTDTGHVFVFSGGTGAALYSLAGGFNDSFGTALAAIGDVDADGKTDFVVGAQRDSSVANDAGKAYLYSGAAGALIRTWGGSLVQGFFGGQVAGVGDQDGDGVPDVGIAAHGDTTTGFGSGAVRIYSGATGALIVAYFGGTTYARLSSCASPGDVDGDGRADLLLGYQNQIGAGRVDLRSGATGALIYSRTAAAMFDSFGTTVSAGGDVDLDGVGDFLVGAPSDSTIATFAGAARVYSGLTGTLLYSYYGTTAFAGCGRTLAIVGDVDGDGAADFAVGSPTESPFGVNVGGARVYSGASGTMLGAFFGSGSQDGLAHGLSGAGDVDGDGFADVLVGAPYDDAFGTNVGRLRVLSFAGALRYGAPSGAGSQATLAWVKAPGLDPAPGSVVFTGAPPFAFGFLGVAALRWFEAAPAFTVLIDPSPTTLGLLPFQCDASGALAIPASLRVPGFAGISVFLQAVAEGPLALAPIATNGLELRLID
jgi:hypothetical protein